MKNITFSILAVVICFFSFVITPEVSKANSVDSLTLTAYDNTNNYVEYIDNDGVTYIYTYNDDGKLISVEVSD